MGRGPPIATCDKLSFRHSPLPLELNRLTFCSPAGETSRALKEDPDCNPNDLQFHRLVIRTA